MDDKKFQIKNPEGLDLLESCELFFSHLGYLRLKPVEINHAKLQQKQNESFASE
eukprot:Pgem_evm1s13174